MSALASWHQQMATLTAAGAPFAITELNGQPAFAHAPATLNTALEQGRVHGAQDFIVCHDQRLSFDTYYAEVERVAAALLSRGLAQGERVAIAMRNRPEWLIAFHAIIKAGGVACALNSWWQGDELAAALADCGASWLIADAERLARLDGRLEHLAVIGVDGAAANDFAALSGPTPARWPLPAPEDAAAILFTSGTGARAKAALLSQRALAQAVFSLDFFAAVGAMVQPELIARTRGVRMKSLLAVPLFHVSGLIAQFFSALRGGRCLIMMKKWDAAEALRLIETEAITQFNGSPAMQVDLINHPGFSSEKLSSLIGLGYGGAGVPRTLSGDIAAQLPQVIQGSGYGMTESSGIGCVSSGVLFAEHPDATGLPSPVVRLRVVDAAGNTLPAGEEGEIQLSGPVLMDGYWLHGQLERSTFDGGWFASGDIGRIDETGLVYLTGRNKEVINRGGEKIALVEVENCLIAHPDVLEVAAFAVPDTRLGERLEAQVVMKPGKIFDAGAIRGFALARLAAYKVPTTIHLRMDALPRNASGKLLRRQLGNAVRN
ncbi:class I adenylate-forming enzyme family protein [Craterilacuibacter sinensis]|uniref:AMP-binding protein n=1 Tax=Craterilacuibacter sinensis TaxID=2686017 RepID=A0A845BQ23_9NEIS|nr:class I adenylate-forming enzyme family protein [Craterilacuibacter sinensis]MXR37500.1 AMP-binding protein [Craterilacuibacter sinensis]